MKLVPTMLLAAAACLATLDASAVECAYKGVDADARVVHESAEMFDPAAWLSHGQCERLRVASGQVRVIYRAADGRFVKRTVSQGRLVARGEGVTDSVLGEIGLMLAGDERVRAGRSRSSSATFDSVERALPNGQLVQPDGPLEIAIPVAADEIGADFRLTQEGRMIYQAKLSRQALLIPAGTLVAGKSYDWTVSTKQDKAKGAFTVVSPGSLSSALQDVPAAADPAQDKLEKASALLKAGYAMEARKLLREVMAE